MYYKTKIKSNTHILLMWFLWICIPLWSCCPFIAAIDQFICTFHLAHLVLNSCATSWCRVLLEKLTVAWLVWKFPVLLDSKSLLLPCLQEPTSGPYPEPVDQVYTLTHYFFKILLIFSSQLFRGLPSGPSFLTKILY